MAVFRGDQMSAAQDAEGMKRMAQLLKDGAKMLDKNCPQCGSPLFQLKTGEIRCAKCDKRVVIVGENEPESPIVRTLLWEEVEGTLLAKLDYVNRRIQNEQDPEEIRRLVNTVAAILEVYDRLKKSG